MESSQQRVVEVDKAVIVLGLAGKGKSTLLNALHSGNPDGQMFKAAESADPVTLCIQKETFPIYGGS